MLYNHFKGLKMNSTTTKLRKSAQMVSDDQIYLTSIVIPKEITSSIVHHKIEEYQLTLKFSKDPRITKPGAAYELIKLGLKSLGLIE
jgi:hypothetical protein